MKIVRFIALFFTSLIVLFGHRSRAADDNSGFLRYLRENMSNAGIPPRFVEEAIQLTGGKPIPYTDRLIHKLGNFAEGSLVEAYRKASWTWNQSHRLQAAGQVPFRHQEHQFVGDTHANQPHLQQPWQTPFDASTDELMRRFNRFHINATHGLDTSYPSGSTSARMMSGGSQFYPSGPSTSSIMTDRSQFRPPGRTTRGRSRAGHSQNPLQPHRSQGQGGGSPKPMWLQTAANELGLDENSILFLHQRMFLLQQWNANHIEDRAPIGSPTGHFALTFGDLRKLNQFICLWNETNRTITGTGRQRGEGSSRRP